MEARFQSISYLLRQSSIWGLLATCIFAATMFIPGWNMIHYMIFMSGALIASPLLRTDIDLTGIDFEMIALIVAIVVTWFILSALRFTFLFSIQDLPTKTKQTK
jgi:hypothetical protein